MSKTTVKKYLSSMGHDDLVKVIMNLYDAKKEAKEYLEYLACPNEHEKLEQYKDIIKDEFDVNKHYEPKLRFNVCKKAISDFKKLNPSPDSLADLMITFVSCGCEFTCVFGDMWEQYYTVMENNFRSSLKYIVDNGLFDSYKPRIMQCIKWAESCGWGFSDTLWDYYYEIAGDLD